jgi:hypothetical protein
MPIPMRAPTTPRSRTGARAGERCHNWSSGDEGSEAGDRK